MDVRFEAVRSVAQISGQLIYRPSEYSFSMIPSRREGFTSVLIDDLSLEVDESGRVISIWGMCPHTRWVEAELLPPDMADDGAIFAITDRALQRGVSVRVNSTKYLPTRVDRASGWVRIEGATSAAVAVRLFPNVVFEIGTNGEFSSLWLRPKVQQ